MGFPLHRFPIPTVNVRASNLYRPWRVEATKSIVAALQRTHVWGAIMFSITSGQLPFIIQYLQRPKLGWGSGGPLQEAAV